MKGLEKCLEIWEKSHKLTYGPVDEKGPPKNPTSMDAALIKLKFELYNEMAHVDAMFLTSKKEGAQVNNFKTLNEFHFQSVYFSRDKEKTVGEIADFLSILTIQDWKDLRDVFNKTGKQFSESFVELVLSRLPQVKA